MRSFKKIIATLLLFATILVPAFAAQAESLNAILKYSIYDLYSGEFVQEVNFLTHSSKDASIVQTVDWFNQRGIMMDPKRFNLKVSSYLTEYSTSKGNLSAYTADIMVYTTEADVLKNLGIKAETEPGVRNVIEMPQYEPERQMREAWENATNSVPTAITPNAPAAESSSQASGSQINKPVTVEKSSSNEVGAKPNENSRSNTASQDVAYSVVSDSKPNENSRSNTASQDIAYSVVSDSKPDESNKPANNQNATDNKVAANQQNNNANQVANKPAANNQQVTVNKTANNNSQSESRSEASQAPVVQKKALPKTGEESSFGWLLALVLVIAGATVLFGYKKTRKQ